ncbi:hypothetical protein TVAG_470340 [Trichomonas vaginalis G3]|uniref:Uncharacterized protein n=1 Tax=Trichomonas vaginalis (strain ATCC PRA-98 / G3) TaxID=412133 RepID=A2G443_TRIV3|nr:hypothetical protein TVAGG3_0238120 [Trichomonas vaginalis G3]EAX88077.1 hypothetical protein TVAG_470340 [Trichomonas vaginalis G3]KAI5553133.1 hypothetical protein TVAGG3_0238120 [Trichomonas vaginalis G3]|eukprot:XP_001301007.1 hypothetical protein [Trichomonas vaginalis G3]
MSSYAINVTCDDKVKMYTVAAMMLNEGFKVEPIKGVDKQTFKATLARLSNKTRKKELAQKRSQCLSEYKQRMAKPVNYDEEFLQNKAED